MMPCCRQNGFSLLEVLVAFAILSISLGALYQMMGTSLNNLSLADAYTRAMIIAESKLAEVGAQSPLVAGNWQGETQDGYQWQVTAAPYSDSKTGRADSGFDAFTLHVDVQWQMGRKIRHYRLTTLRLQRKKP